MKDLRRQMTEDMKLRALAEGTQTTYLEAITNLAKHYNCPPDQLSEQQVKDFIVHLTKTKGLDNSTVRVHFYAIKFLYQRTLNKQWRSLELIRIKKTKKVSTRPNTPPSKK